MTSLRVEPETALQLLSQIPHAKCQNALEAHWHVDHENLAKAQSVLWLFCWAKTGLGSESARLEAQNVFNEILTHDCFDEKTTFFDWFDARVDHEYARRYRYSPKYLEDELDSLLCPTSNT